MANCFLEPKGPLCVWPAPCPSGLRQTWLRSCRPKRGPSTPNPNPAWQRRGPLFQLIRWPEHSSTLLATELCVELHVLTAMPPVVNTPPSALPAMATARPLLTLRFLLECPSSTHSRKRTHFHRPTHGAHPQSRPIFQSEVHLDIPLGNGFGRNSTCSPKPMR